MAYKLLGFVVWRAALWFLRRKVRSASPVPQIAAAGLLLGAGALIVSRRLRSRPAPEL